MSYTWSSRVFSEPSCSAMEGVAYVSFTSSAAKSLSFSSLSSSSIITVHQNHRKNTSKSISTGNLAIRASSGSSSGTFSDESGSISSSLFVIFVNLFSIPNCDFFLGSVVTLLDYGAGNVRSLRNAIHYLGFDIQDVSHLSLLFFYFNWSIFFSLSFELYPDWLNVYNPIL